jgi:hypothetical protein
VRGRFPRTPPLFRAGIKSHRARMKEEEIKEILAVQNVAVGISEGGSPVMA